MKGIPIPPKRQPSTVRRGWAWALAHAEVGDSIFLAGSATKKAGRTAYTYGSGWFRMETERNGVRIWKLKEPPFPDGRRPTLLKNKKAGGVTE